MIRWADMFINSAIRAVAIALLSASLHAFANEPTRSQSAMKETFDVMVGSGTEWRTPNPDFEEGVRSPGNTPSAGWVTCMRAVAEVRGDVQTRRGERYDIEYCFVFRFRDGRIVEVVEYCDTDLEDGTLAMPS